MSAAAEGSARGRLRRALGRDSPMLAFGVVGALGFVVDLLVFTVLRGGGGDHLLSGPIGAKTAAVAAATLVTWLGNRYWTFRENRRADRVAELAQFCLVAVGGLVVSLIPLAITHYLLGFRSLLADTLSANVIGLVLATAFRYVLARWWVFRASAAPPLG